MSVQRRFLSRAWRRYWLSDPLEGLVAWSVYGFFALVPLDWSSAFWGWAMRVIGPRLPAHKIAERNLDLCFPDMPAAERARILRGMWDNLGRVVGEYPHNRALWRTPGRIAYVGTEDLTPRTYADRPVIFFSGHLANWEVAAPCAHAGGWPVWLVYRAPNNRFTDRLIRQIRRPFTVAQLPKGPEGARQTLRAMRQKGALTILVDQKTNDGIAVPFFGRPAMTTPAAAQFHLRMGAVLLPSRVVRTGGAWFEMRVEPPLTIEPTGDVAADQAALTERMNAILERWIREHPEQWLWIHRRWPESGRRVKKPKQ